MKGIIEAYCLAMEVNAQVEYRAIEAAHRPFLHPGRSAEIVIAGKPVGYLGELHPREANRLDLTAPCAVFELDLEILISYGFPPRKTISPPPRFPAVRRDVALVVDRNISAASVIRTLRESSDSPLLADLEVFDVFEGERIGPGRKSVAVACWYRAQDRTLTDEEVNRVHAGLVDRARTRLKAELRS